ncbi:MAG: ATP-binding cassette domain-containing protein [Chitinophagales bacterium]
MTETASAPAAVAGRGLSVRASRDGRLLLDDVSFTAAAGEVLALLGPSGAGKSTLLKLVNRLIEPESGEVLLDGTDIRKLDPTVLRRRVGMVFQQPAMFEGTVRDNLAYGPRLHRLPFDEKTAVALMEAVRLEPAWLDNPARSLSGGEQQRVALARCLALAPDVLLLDEPTSALDPAAAAGVEELILSLQRARRLTVLWVTHSVEQAARVADRVLALSGGRRASEAPAEEFFARPRAELLALYEGGNAR